MVLCYGALCSACSRFWVTCVKSQSRRNRCISSTCGVSVTVSRAALLVYTSLYNHSNDIKWPNDTPQPERTWIQISIHFTCVMQSCPFKVSVLDSKTSDSHPAHPPQASLQIPGHGEWLEELAKRPAKPMQRHATTCNDMQGLLGVSILRVRAWDNLGHTTCLVHDDGPSGLFTYRSILLMLSLDWKFEDSYWEKKISYFIPKGSKRPL